MVDTIPYIRDMRAGRTRPHRGTWLIWSSLSTVALISQHADGAQWSLVMTGSQAVLSVTIFLLALRCGTGGVSRGDAGLIAIAAFGIAGWVLADEPAVATSFVVAADLVGVALMMPKTYRDPGSETLSTFALASLAGALSAASVGALDVTLLLYPIYFTVGNGAIALLIVVRRRALDTAPGRGRAWPAPVTAEGGAD